MSDEPPPTYSIIDPLESPKQTTSDRSSVEPYRIGESSTTAPQRAPPRQRPTLPTEWTIVRTGYKDVRIQSDDGTYLFEMDVPLSCMTVCAYVTEQGHRVAALGTIPCSFTEDFELHWEDGHSALFSRDVMARNYRMQCGSETYVWDAVIMTRDYRCLLGTELVASYECAALRLDMVGRIVIHQAAMGDNLIRTLVLSIAFIEVLRTMHQY